MEEKDLLTNPRDARALVYHARRVNGGQRANGAGKVVEELCVELGVHFDWVRLEPRGVKNLRKKLTKELSPEKLLLLLSSSMFVGSSSCFQKLKNHCHLSPFSSMTMAFLSPLEVKE